MRRSPELHQIQGRVDAILAGPVAGGPVSVREATEPAFSPYVNEDLDEATDLASRMMAIADEVGGVAGMDAALAEAERRLPLAKPGLVAHAVRLFITHHRASAAALRIPSVERRQSRQRPS